MGIGILLTGLFFWLFLGWQVPVLAVQKHALLIGVADYEASGLPSLQGTHNDVWLMHRVLKERFDFQEADITVLVDDKANHRGLEQVFAELAGRIEPGDFVYIHYAGHGSYTPDLNGDEPSGRDQTWVSYGSRRADTQDQDHYDILDDQLNAWLIPIFEKAGQVVFVSDSCHSASVTRGRIAVRAAPLDEREHPLGRKQYPSQEFLHGVVIGAAGDREAAGEFEAEDGNSYGLFTWHWAQALQQARPGETWRDLFKRAQAQVTYVNRTQRPQLKGQGSDHLVFGGEFETSPRVSVTAVRADGQRATIGAGFLAGVTQGSVYRRYDSKAPSPSSLATLEITRVGAFDSEGRVSGTLSTGDLLVEENHAYTVSPIPVWPRADLPQDQALLGQLKALLSGDGLPGFTLAEAQESSQLVLHVLRPKQEDGEYLYKNPGDSLPRSFPKQPPEVWVLSYTEQLWHENLRISFQDQAQGLKALEENLRTLARVKEIKQLASGQTPAIALYTVHWIPVDLCSEQEPDYCLKLPDGSFFQKQGEYAREEMEGRRFPPGTLFTFILENQASVGYYVYLINISPGGEVRAIFPTSYNRDEDAWLAAGQRRDFRDLTGLMTDTTGEENIKLLVTKEPIEIALLEQEGFRRQQQSRGRPLNPLEQLLVSATHGTRAALVSMRQDDWGSLQYSFEVGK